MHLQVMLSRAMVFGGGPGVAQGWVQLWSRLCLVCSLGASRVPHWMNLKMGSHSGETGPLFPWEMEMGRTSADPDRHPTIGRERKLGDFASGSPGAAEDLVIDLGHRD